MEPHMGREVAVSTGRGRGRARWGLALGAVVLTGWVGSTAWAQSSPLADEARAAHKRKDYARSAQLFVQLGGQHPGDFRPLYSAACSFALGGRASEAFEQLGRAVESGFQDVEQLQREGDLTGLHGDPRWEPLVERVRARRRMHDRLWSSPALKTPYRDNLSEDEKVAGLSRFWSEAKYNFAYFDRLPDLDWDAVYLEYLPRVRRSRSTAAYYRLLREVCAKLGDAHTNVWPPGKLEAAFFGQPLVRTRLVEDRVLVLRVDDPALGAQGIVAGLEVIAVDGIPVRTYAEQRVAPFESSSTKQDAAVRSYDYALLSGRAGTPVALTLRDERGRTFVRRLPRLVPGERWKRAPEVPPMVLRKLPGNVAHVALNGFDGPAAADQFEAAFAEIARADALILDLRENGGGNSGVGYRILAQLTDKPFKVSAWRTRNYRPAFRAWGVGESSYGVDAPLLPPSGARVYRKPVVLLTSPRTFSAAEDFAVAFDVMDRGPIVGEATGGSTGQPLNFDLPGGGGARVCTKRDTYPDGRPFVGVGVQPDHPVQPTVADVRAGRDTVLEAALRLLAKQARL
jgi:carboxyl-terminal processing protease